MEIMIAWMLIGFGVTLTLTILDRYSLMAWSVYWWCHPFYILEFLVRSLVWPISLGQIIKDNIIVSRYEK